MWATPLVMRLQTPSTFMTLFIVSLKGGRRSTTKPDEAPDNVAHFSLSAVFQEGSHAEGQSKTKQESAWLFRLWYTFDHKYPLHAQLFWVEATQQLLGAVFPLQAPPVCLGSCTSIYASLKCLSERIKEHPREQRTLTFSAYSAEQWLPQGGSLSCVLSAACSCSCVSTLVMISGGAAGTLVWPEVNPLQRRLEMMLLWDSCNRAK